MGISNDRVFRAARRAGIVAIGAASAAAGLLAAFRLMPEHIPATPTVALLALTGLVVLPGLAVGAWALDCKALANAVTRTRRPVMAAEAAAVVSPAAPAAQPATPHQPLLAAEAPAQRVHAAHDGGAGDHHKRRVAAVRA